MPRETGALMSLTKTDSRAKTNERAPRKFAYQPTGTRTRSRPVAICQWGFRSVRASSSHSRPSVYFVLEAPSRVSSNVGARFRSRAIVPRSVIHRAARRRHPSWTPGRVNGAHTRNVSLFFCWPLVCRRPHARRRRKWPDPDAFRSRLDSS